MLKVKPQHGKQGMYNVSTVYHMYSTVRQYSVWCVTVYSVTVYSVTVYSVTVYSTYCAVTPTLNN